MVVGMVFEIRPVDLHVKLPVAVFLDLEEVAVVNAQEVFTILVLCVTEVQEELEPL